MATMAAPGHARIESDGFVIESNTGTDDDLRADLGLKKLGDKPIDDKLAPADKKKVAAPAAAAVEDEDAEPSYPTRAPQPKKDRRNPDTRRQSLQAEIDAEVERKWVAKAEADAEEGRLKAAREERARLAQPPAAPRTPPADAARPPAPKTPKYDGLDPSDPEPKIEEFANDPSGDPYTAWLLARQRHATRAEWRIQQHNAQESTRRDTDERVYTDRMSALRQKHEAHAKTEPDWYEKRVDPRVAEYLTWSTPDAPGVPLGDLVMDAPNTTELLIYFSDNKQELARISALHPFQQALEFGKLQGTLLAKAAPPPRTPPASRAKPLVPHVDGLGSAPADNRSDDELSEDEHEAKYSKMRRQHR
ncbi:MAG TPA: hypothetical protein VK504_06080 [Vicinamibacterales bacterium]|nr:hypothetical protein [Vicinamibacterales bacterium]